jgi:UDP-glucose 4-epimerase
MTQSSALGPQPFHKPERWLVTGGCGFIGTSLIASLLKENPNVKIRVLDNLSVGSGDDLGRICEFTILDPTLLSPQNPVLSPQSLDPLNRSPSVELIIGDILDADLVLKIIQGIDVIVHLAANTGVGPSVDNPRKDMEANVIGTFNMLDAARQKGVKRFIFASSGAPVGECDPPIHEELAPHPVSPYGASKLAGEGYCSAFFRTFGLETVALRFGNVYGPGSSHKNSVVSKFIRQAMRGETLEVYGDGNQTRDFIYVDDLITAILLAARTDGVGGEVFQIATNVETTVNELAQKLVSVLTASGHKDIEMDHGQERLGDVRRNFSDTSKAQEFLGWKAEADLDEGLRRTVNWFTGL